MYIQVESRQSLKRGGTLVEMVVMLGILSALCGLGIRALSGIGNGTANAKLGSDIQTLNKAVAAFLNNGGRIGSGHNGNDVLRLLKSNISAQDAKQLVGVAGPFLDKRIVGRPALVEDKRRIIWDHEKRVFKITTSGGGWDGIYFDESQSLADHGEESRKTAFQYSKVDTWVWDYKDRTLEANVAVVGGGYVESRLRLNPPRISPGSGIISHLDFPLGVTIENPNPVGSSVLMFSVDGAPWSTLTGNSISITKAPITQVAAYAASISPNFIDSLESEEVYQSYYMRCVVSLKIKGAAGEPWADFSYSDGNKGIQWGRVLSDSGSPCRIETIKDGDYEIGSGESHIVGALAYHNGTTKAGTNIVACVVEVTVQLTFPEVKTVTFDIPLNIENSIHFPDLDSNQHFDSLTVNSSSHTVDVPVIDRMFTLQLEFSGSLLNEDGVEGPNGEHPVEENETSLLVIVASLR
jgi:hypothetical protein